MAARKTSTTWFSSRSAAALGLGLYVNGRLVRGENGAAGEIGYLPIGGDPLQAESRLQGCLEYQIGATGVVRRYRESGGSDVDSEREVFERAQAGDPIAADVVDETARLTGLAAAAVIATVDPQLLVLGGSVGARADFADKVARAAVATRAAAGGDSHQHPRQASRRRGRLVRRFAPSP